jgi:hypothetical protein
MVVATMKKAFTYALLFFLWGICALQAQDTTRQQLPAVWSL